MILCLQQAESTHRSIPRIRDPKHGIDSLVPMQLQEKKIPTLCITQAGSFGEILQTLADVIL